MQRLKEYIKSKVNNIQIQYGKETISFNLWEEVKINEAMIDRELKTQPGYYAFCLSLHKKLLTIFETSKLNRKKTHATLLFQAKKKIQEGTSRPYTDDMAQAWVEKHKDYMQASRDCIKAKDDADAMYACVKAFEQRKDLLQTISSNQRKEH